MGKTLLEGCRRQWRTWDGRQRVLLVLSAVLLLCVQVRPGVRVNVGGQEIGIYAPGTVARSLAAAEAAAGEILGEPVDLHGAVSLAFCLTAEGCSRDVRRLERSLLEQAPGVERLWVVKAGDTALGAVDDPSVVGELVHVLVRSCTGPYTVSAALSPELRLERSYVRSDAVLTPDEISSRLQESVTVETRELTAEELPPAENGIVTASEA